MRSAEEISAENIGQEEAATIATGYRVAEKRAARRVFWSDLAIRTVFVLLLLGLWQWFHYILVIRPADASIGALFPSPPQVGEWLWQGFGLPWFTGDYKPPPGLPKPHNFWEVLQQVEFPKAILASISRLMEGYIIAVVIGIPLGLLVAQSALMNKTLGWLALSLQALPSICWIPLALLWFGQFGKTAPILFVTVMGALFATVVAVADGIRQVPPLLSRAGRTLGADGLRLYFSVLLPAALPSIVIGLRIGWSFAWRSLMAAELIVNHGGLGFSLHQHQQYLEPNGVLATIVVIIVISLGVQSVVFGPIERRLQDRWGLAPPPSNNESDTSDTAVSKRRPAQLRWAMGIALVVLIIAGVTVLTAPKHQVAARDNIKKVTVGYNATIALPQALIGLADGEFARLMPGVQFVGEEYATGPNVVGALRAGVIDIGYSGPFPPLKAYMRAKDVLLLAGAAKGGTELMVEADAPIRILQDLKGKTIGISQLGSTADAMVRFQLLKVGLTPGVDVTIQEVAPADQAMYLQRGDVIAVSAPAPWPAQVAARAHARPLLNANQMLDNGDYLAGVVYTTKKFADAHPEFVKKFIAAHRTITDRLNEDRVAGDAAVLAAWSKATGKTLPPAIAKAAFASIQYTADASQKNLERLAEISRRGGILSEKGDLSGFVFKAE
ncbi:MAG TPA: ABC transporter permease subunit [Abditibacteriaceae bacterium]|nr:ABC transporter permease subunit [Abditibacteriaceae bacterium]